MISSLDLIDGRGPGFPRPAAAGFFWAFFSPYPYPIPAISSSSETAANAAFTSSVLGCSPDAYIANLLDRNSWGGE